VTLETFGGYVRWSLPAIALARGDVRPSASLFPADRSTDRSIGRRQFCSIKSASDADF
jgi:hypothetical protein